MSTLARQLQRMTLNGHRGGQSEDLNSERAAPIALTPNCEGAVFESGIIQQVQEGQELAEKYQDDNALMMFNLRNYVYINEALKTLLGKIIEDITLEGGEPGEWLDPWSVQQYIEQQWGLGLALNAVQPTNKTLSTLLNKTSVPEQHDNESNVGSIEEGVGNMAKQRGFIEESGNDSNYTMSPLHPVPSFPFYKSTHFCPKDACFL